MIRNLTLEISLKPFYDKSDSAIRAVCEKIHLQWEPLFKDIDQISIMFWTADGSEILDYSGDMNDTFEWSKYIGVANPEIYGEIPDLPQRELSMHKSPRIYRENPPEYTYYDLRNILTIMREVFGRKGRVIRLGATFDPGPEFAVSSFKYKRHNEICMANTMSESPLGSFVCCYAELNGDDKSYAGFPDGIKQGTPFGKFLGRQTRIFCKDLGFDYVWLSNGFGFGLETWGVCGAVFDGIGFDNSSCEDVKEKIFRFWTEFRNELPDLPIETRGTNLSTGMDLSSDAVPLREIYANVPGVTPPPNSPWAALNGDFGTELAGWMSHIAELPPETGYPFRFYTHDPWFINSPWLDRYGRNPHDIYMPLAITRLDENGKTMSPQSISILSIDDSYGEMPDIVPNEVIPHVKDGLRTSPDVAGPVIWLYPFDEYHDMTFNGQNIEEVFFGDWFMRTAINTGFQLNTVVSSKNFASALQSGACHGNVIAAPTAIFKNSKVAGLLQGFADKGGKVLLYGPVVDKCLQEFLGLSVDDSVEGELEIEIDGDKKTFKHTPIYSGGSINTVKAKDGCEVIASVSDKVYAMTRKIGKGTVGWVRGSNSFTIKQNGRYPEMLDRSKYFYPETLMNTVLGKLGYVFDTVKYAPDQPDPVIVSNYNKNALYVSTYVPDINTTEKLRYPEGAPVFVETETLIEDGKSVYHFPKAEHLESRVFVDMQDGPLKCVEFCLATPEVKRRIEVQGLQNATVRIRPESGYEDIVKVLQNPEGAPFVKGNFLKLEREPDFAGTVLTCRNVNGTILISW